MTVPDLVVHADRAVPGAGAEVPLTLTVSGGVISAVGPLDRSATGAEVVELGPDVVLLPGLVDTHVHVNEPGRTEWEGFASATRAAASSRIAIRAASARRTRTRTIARCSW